MFVTHDPLGNPVDRRHPWNQHTNPQPQKRDFDDKYSWVMSPRWFDGKDHLALDTGGGPLARLWSTALAGLVDIGYVKATGNSVQINLPKTALKGPVSFEWKIPQWSNTHRAQPGPHLLPGLRRGLRAALRREGAGRDPGRPHQDLGDVRGARRGHRLRLHRGGARRAVAPHGDPGRQDRQLPPLPADAVERQPARHLRHARAPTRTPCRDSRSSRRTTGSTSRASTSCARCAASTRACRAACTCTSATGKTLERLHSPTQSVDRRVTAVTTSPPDDRADRCGRPASGSRRCSTPASAGGAVARERAEELVRLVADLYGAGLERLLEIVHDAGRLDDDAARRAGRRRAGRQPAAGARPAPRRRRDPGGAGAGRRPAVPRLARRRRRAARRHRRRASCGCGCWAAATAARRRRSR